MKKHGDLLMQLGRDYGRDNAPGQDESLPHSQAIDATAKNVDTGKAA